MATAVVVNEHRPVERLFYRPEEAAEALGVARVTIFRMIAAGALPSRKFGKSRRIPIAAVVALAHGCQGDGNHGA